MTVGGMGFIPERLLMMMMMMLGLCNQWANLQYSPTSLRTPVLAWVLVVTYVSLGGFQF